jgi:hypothetical protein
MTQTEFFAYVNLNPRSLNVWYDQSGPPYIIRGVSVPVVDKTNEDSKTYLSQVEEISIPLSGGSVDRITLKVKQRKYVLSSGYSCYILLVDPLTVSSIGSTVPATVSVLISPTTDIATFEDSSYNVLGGSIEDTRQSTYIMKSDRYKVGTLANPTYTGPLNINQIISGSAPKANVQDSNYSSLSWMRSRYDGAKTNVLDYKTDPALAGRTFLGADFASGSDVNQINYLLSSSQVVYKDFFYAGRGDTPGFDNTGLSGYEFQTTYNTTQNKVLYIVSTDPGKNPFITPRVGDLITTGNTGTEEIMKITAIGVVETFPIRYSLDVQRSWNSVVAEIPSIPIYNIKSVQIYNIEGNRLSGVPKGLVIVKETGKTLGIDRLGYVVSSR